MEIWKILALALCFTTLCAVLQRNSMSRPGEQVTETYMHPDWLTDR